MKFATWFVLQSPGRKAHKVAQVDVITRTKNRPLFLKRCLDDLKAQTFRDFRWIVVNDGGDPAPVEKCAQEAKDAGLETRLISLPNSVGMEAAANRGAEAGEAPLIAIHDDDDTWSVQYLSRMTSVLEDDTVIGAICWSEECREKVQDNAIIESMRRKSDYCPAAIDLALMAAHNRFPPIAFLFRRSAYEKAGKFEETLHVLGDWDFNLRMLQIGDIAVVPELLASYHVRDEGSAGANSITAQHEKHVQTASRLRNKYIRQDMQSGCFGVGSMMAFAAIAEDMAARTSYHQRLERLKRMMFKR